MRRTRTRRGRLGSWGLVLAFGGCLAWQSGGCGDLEVAFDPASPGRGPGELVGRSTALNDAFAGGVSMDATPADVLPPSGEGRPPCDAECQAHCDGLALSNPVDRGVCRRLWGVGLDTRPIVHAEACRRLFADFIGRLPSWQEVEETCGAEDWSAVVRELMTADGFVMQNQRRWADLLRYNNEAVSFERIYDMDALVAKLYRGQVAYDTFAAVVSAHPVLTRRFDTPGDRVEALFTLFLGRPPHENERSDLARLYALWGNGYYLHPTLQQRLPDAVLRYRCVDAEGHVDPGSNGECTSVLWGYHSLILQPDFRALDGEMWSGLLVADEWTALQLPGRLLAQQLGYWEHAVDAVLQQYLGYDVASQVPEVRQALVHYVLEHHGDIRAAHYAVATSQLYLQSAAGATTTEHRWTYGPLKQVEVETWLDTLKEMTGYALSRCDHRLPNPQVLMEAGFLGRVMLEHSRWDVREGRVEGNYRDLARTLGGCPENLAGSRFKTVSILTTATQERLVSRICNPSLTPDRGVESRRLLPRDMTPDRALDPDVAESILRAQTRAFLARNPRDAERAQAREAAEACAPKPCTAEMFARPLCYALLSSSEMLFY